MTDVQWRTVQPWRFSDEAAVADRVRQGLPAHGTHHGWANFRFVAATGHPLSVDLLVLGPSGLHLVEFFTRTGRLHNKDQVWLLDSTADRTAFDSPLRLAGVKAAQLSALLSADAGRKVPVRAAVLLTEPGIRVALDSGNAPASSACIPARTFRTSSAT